MKEIILIIQIAMIFIGSIVGAGVCSGRELNQFFATYGIAGFFGLILCGLLYIVFSKMIILITARFKVCSYNEFVDLVCPKFVARFINVILTLFLLSSTSIILAGSGSIISQYFHVSKWIGVGVMIGCSSIFLLRNTEGLFEVNSIVVPALFITMTAIFFSYISQNPSSFSYAYVLLMPRQKTNLIVSTLVYVSFNILTIIGVVVPLTHEIRKSKEIIKGIVVGSSILTIISIYITFLMLTNPFHASLYEVPLLGLAMEMNKVLQFGMLGIMWLEMFSSQVSNVYSLSYFMRNKFKVPYNKGIFLAVIIATPFSMVGFAKLVEFLYPLYGELSLVFLFYCTLFFLKMNRTSDVKQLAHNQASNEQSANTYEVLNTK